METVKESTPVKVTVNVNPGFFPIKGKMLKTSTESVHINHVVLERGTYVTEIIEKNKKSK